MTIASESNRLRSSRAEPVVRIRHAGFCPGSPTSGPCAARIAASTRTHAPRPHLAHRGRQGAPQRPNLGLTSSSPRESPAPVHARVSSPPSFGCHAPSHRGHLLSSWQKPFGTQSRQFRQLTAWLPNPWLLFLPPFVLSCASKLSWAPPWGHRHATRCLQQRRVCHKGNFLFSGLQMTRRGITSDCCRRAGWCQHSFVFKSLIANLFFTEVSWLFKNLFFESSS